MQTDGEAISASFVDPVRHGSGYHVAVETCIHSLRVSAHKRVPLLSYGSGIANVAVFVGGCAAWAWIEHVCQPTGGLDVRAYI